MSYFIYMKINRELPKELRSLVKQTVAILGEVIRRELGLAGYNQIEKIRLRMTETRELPAADGFLLLQTLYKKLASLRAEEQHDIAHAFTLMLELMNACENAYRSHRINLENLMTTTRNQTIGELPRAISYVLTAHPTEARSPQNIEIFHEIQNILIQTMNRGDLCQGVAKEVIFTSLEHDRLLHSLEIAWRTPVVRSRIPKVKDEAEHIYSLLFRDEILFSLIDQSKYKVPFYLRSWVGADKDGHPGVNEKTLLQSLNLSRKKLLRIIDQELSEIGKTLRIFPSVQLQKKLLQIEKVTPSLRTIKTHDAKKVSRFTTAITEFKSDYEKNIGAVHPSLNRLLKIIQTFPALVVPLELRESSDIIMSDPKKRKDLSVYKMLRAIEKISRGGNPRFYVRGLIISMTDSVEHLLTAADFQHDVFKNIPLPIIPLFENRASLAGADKIIAAFLKNRTIKKAARNCWSRQIEMMVGYSDSAKEAGVLASRVAISDALPELEKICKQAGLIPVFFHGSGGSIDRGGGSVEDQISWWPKSALSYYKVTVQGEMIERSLATAAIAKRQIEKIIGSAAKGLSKTVHLKQNTAVEKFAEAVSEKYRNRVASADFLKLVETATPYSYLNILKIGSRPAKRANLQSIKGLRAIPWVMCWTQTRVLLPTWWGIGESWNNSADSQKAALKKAFQKDAVFTSYIKALGFTLAKIDLNIWKIYLEQSSLSKTETEKAFEEFQTELKLARKCYFEICGEKNLLWFRPWLGESIILRSPMIHPLNLLQIIAAKNKDLHLLRITVTGISSGMLTTG